jgi:hypothetical protein
MKFCTEAAQTGMDTRRIWRNSASATEGPAGALNSTSRSLKERNIADMPGSASAVDAVTSSRRSNAADASAALGTRYSLILGQAPR